MTEQKLLQTKNLLKIKYITDKLFYLAPYLNKITVQLIFINTDDTIYILML